MTNDLHICSCWTVAHQAPLSMGVSRQKYWSRLPCPPPGDRPDPGIKPLSVASAALAGRFLTTSANWEALPLSCYQDALKKDSRVLLRVGAGNPWFPRLVPVISGRSKGASEKSGILSIWEGSLGTPLGSVPACPGTFGGRRKAVRDRFALQGGTGDFP